MRKKILVLVSIIMALLCLNSAKAYAADEATEIKLNIKAANNESTARLLDDSYSTKITFTVDNPLTITSKDGSSKLYGIYVVWAAVPDEWTLTFDGGKYEGGKNGFLHEYVAIPEGTESATLTLTKKESICKIKAYGKGELPKDVQTWKPVCDKADMLLFSTHADDEILFFGGALAEYAGERNLDVQLVYFSNYFTGTVIREHEKLDGLWAIGVKNYPVNGDFDDQYADNLKAAEKLYGLDNCEAFIVEQIRRFKPQICIAQDTNGEYGHGTHMLTSKAMQEAVTVSMDADKYPESAKEYGTWDVPKTYIHLAKDNPIKLDCRKPLSKFDGQNAVDVASYAYKQHVSQQWCWFYVSDTYEYSIADYGLVRTQVGVDTNNDMMEHLTSYAEQKKIEEAKRAAESEARQAAIEKKAAEKEAKEKASYEHEFGVAKEDVPADKVPNFVKKVGMTLLLIIAVVLAVFFVGSAISSGRYYRKKAKKRKKRRR